MIKWVCAIGKAFYKEELQEYDTDNTFNSRDEAINYGRQKKEPYKAMYDTEYSTFMIGQLELFKPHIDIDEIIERLQDDALDFNDLGDDYLDITYEQKQELEIEINKTFEKWEGKYNLQPTFFNVFNEEKISVVEA